jgi:hypothetical protein
MVYIVNFSILSHGLFPSIRKRTYNTERKKKKKKKSMVGFDLVYLKNKKQKTKNWEGC